MKPALCTARLALSPSGSRAGSSLQGSSTTILLWLLLAFIYACDSGQDSLRPFDMAAYEIPITIQAPDSAHVMVKTYDEIRDITIRKGLRYDIQLFEFNPSMSDAVTEKARQKNIVKDMPTFKQIVLDEEHGFVFATQPDSQTVRYDFRYIHIVDQRELLFQTGITGSYSLPEVKRMYDAVKQSN